MSKAKKAVIAGAVVLVVAAIVVTIVLCCLYFSAWGKMSGNIYVSDAEARLLFGEDSLFLSEDFNEEYGLKPSETGGESMWNLTPITMIAMIRKSPINMTKRRINTTDTMSPTRSRTDLAESGLTIAKKVRATSSKARTKLRVS